MNKKEIGKRKIAIKWKSKYARTGEYKTEEKTGYWLKIY